MRLLKKDGIQADEIALIVCWLGVMIACGVAKQWFLLGLFVAFFILFGILEFACYKVTGRSISNRFRDMRDEGGRGKVMAIIISVFMAAAWIALLVHFWV